LELLLILPCNPCVRLGDYSLCENWRVVLRYVGDLVSSGMLKLAAIDSCKPGLVPWGSEGEFRWCDRSPYWSKSYGRSPELLELLEEAVQRDLVVYRARYKLLIYYVNVKAYHRALLNASTRLGFKPAVDYIDVSPNYNPLSYRSKESLTRLREAALKALKL